MRLRILRICLVVVYALLNLNKVSQAQCPNGGPLQSVTYSYTTNLASLSDSLYYPYKFDPSLGTLMSADLTISTLGNAILEVVNDVGAIITYKITYYRTDYIRGPGLGSGIMLDTTIVYNNITIGASDNPAVETSTPPWASNGPNDDYSNAWGKIQAAPTEPLSSPSTPRVFTQSIAPSDFGEFTGTGSIKFKYDVLASLLAQGFGGRYTQRIVTLNTQVTIGTTYTYCPMSVLAEGKLTFSARKTNNSNIELTWIKEREENNIVYTPEVSINGSDFSSIGTMQSQMPATSSTVVKYEFDYAVPASVNGKIYFRLKQTDAGGKVQYSALTSVNIESLQQSEFSIFPNPAEKEITLQFSSIQKHNLQVNLVNSMGQVMERSNISPNGGRQYKLTFIKRYQPGLYFVLVTNTATRSQHISRLLIR